MTGSLDPITGSLDPITGSLEAITRRGLGLTRWPDDVFKQKTNATNRAIKDVTFMMSSLMIVKRTENVISMLLKLNLLIN